MQKLVLFFVCLSVLACNREHHSLTQADKEKMTNEIQDFFTDYSNAVRTKGLTGEFDFLDRSPDFFWVPPGYDVPISYDSVATVLNSSARQFKSIDNSYDSLRVIPMTSALASYTCLLRSVATDTSGHVTSVQLIETGVVIKRKDGWKLLHGQTSIVD